MMTAPAPDTPPTSVAYVYPTPTGGEVLVTIWADGTGQVAFRDHPGGTWGPPVAMEART